MLFDGWLSMLRVLVTGTLGYIALVLLLRISGKRTLSKMNAFDLIVTVALGSSFATVLLAKEVSLASGVFALVLLVTMQYVVAWLSVRSAMVRRLVKSEPRMLFYGGNYLHGEMRAERVTEDEVLSAIRAQGIFELKAVDAVVLETDGSFTVVSGHHDEGGRSSLSAVRGEPKG